MQAHHQRLGQVLELMRQWNAKAKLLGFMKDKIEVGRADEFAGLSTEDDLDYRRRRLHGRRSRDVVLHVGALVCG